MTTLAEHIIVNGAENRPPMLEKSMYDSWSCRTRLFIKGKKPGRIMLDLIDNGPLVYPTIEENGQIRPKKYSKLTEAQQLKDDCNVQATNIILHGLLPDVYVLVNHQEAAKDIWDKVKLLMKGIELSNQERECRLMTMQQVQVNTKFLNVLPSEWSKFVTDVKLAKSLYTTNYDQLYAYLSQHERHANEVCITRKRYPDPLALQGEYLIKFINKAMAFLFAVASRFPPSNNQLRMSSNPRNQATIQDGRFIFQQVQGRQSQSFAGTRNRGIATTSRGNYAAGQPRVVKCYNCQGEGHMARQYPGISKSPVAQQTIPQNSAFQTEDLDAYDSDCDDLSSAKAVLMENLSSCDPDVLSEVPYSDSYPNDMINQDVQEMQYSQQIHTHDFPDNKIHSDCNIIPYSQYLVIPKEHVVISVIDDEETLILEEIKEDFGKCFVIQKELSAEQAFWLKHSFFSETPVTSHTPVRIKAPSELPKSVENSDSNAQLQEKAFTIAALKNELRKLKGKNVFDTTVSKPSATIATGMFKLDIEPISHILKNNRDAHEVYIEKTIENTDTLCGFVERARTQNPSEPLLESACMFTKHVHELLVYISQTYPNSPKPSEKLVAVTQIMTQGDLKRFRLEGDYDIWSMRMEKYLTHTDYALWEVIVNGDAPAAIASASAGTEGPIPPKTVEQEAKDVALIEQIEDIQARIDANKLLAEILEQEEREQFTIEEKSRLLVEIIAERKRFFAAQRAGQIRNKPPTRTQLRSKMFTYLKNMGRFTYNQLKNKSLEEIQMLYEKEQKWINDFLPMDFELEVQRLKSAVVVPVEEVYVEALQVKYPIIDWEVYSEDTRRNDMVKLWDLVKERFSTTEPTDDKEKELNDRIAKIMGYGDYQMCNVTISRVYYVEGLDDVVLLKGSRGLNLYIVAMDNLLLSSPICLLSKASKTKSWLWHRRLSHLNFDYITSLAKHATILQSFLGWFGFTKRPNVRACYSKNLDSVKNWNDHFFWVDEFVVPTDARFNWFSGSNIVKDRAPAPSEYNVEHVTTLIAHASPFLRFPEEFLCWVGISRNYLLNKDTYPRFEYED
ncbi:integrase, catalytic region, zinc finger, CCHC-type containing protein, partial [Tanacetum coccineum]